MTLVHEEEEEVVVEHDQVDALGETFLELVSRVQALSRSPVGSLSNARFGVLQAVASRGTPPMNTVARAVGVTPRTLTDLVDGLEGARLLRRVPNPSDRREVLLELTDLGSAQVGANRMARASMAGQIFQSLTLLERRTLTAILEKLITNGPAGYPGLARR